MRELQRFRHQDFGDFVRTGTTIRMANRATTRSRADNFHLLQAGVHDELAIHKSDPHRPDGP